MPGAPLADAAKHRPHGAAAAQTPGTKADNTANGVQPQVLTALRQHTQVDMQPQVPLHDGHRVIIKCVQGAPEAADELPWQSWVLTFGLLAFILVVYMVGTTPQPVNTPVPAVVSKVRFSYCRLFDTLPPSLQCARQGPPRLLGIPETASCSYLQQCML